jgi:hypothetical protein
MKEKTMHILTLFGTAVVLMSFGVIAKLLFDGARAERRQADDTDRTVELVRRARLLYPRANDIDALDYLYNRLYKEINAAKRMNQDVRELVRDHTLAFNERLRLIQLEAERDSKMVQLRSVARV